MSSTKTDMNQAVDTAEEVTVEESAKASNGLFRRAWNGIRSVVSSPSIAQCSYLDVDPSEESSEVLYRQLVTRTREVAHPINFEHRTHIITGISCQPKDKKTNSAETEILEGGVGYKYVKMVLNPVQKGEWSCLVQIQGKLES